MLSIQFGKARMRLPVADLVSDHEVSVEFKRVFAMPSGQLRQLHGATVEVQLDIGGIIRSICGKGTYDAKDPDLGSVLKILINDPTGNFEFLIAESEWSGSLESSDIPGCDYRISMRSCTPC